MSVYLTLVAFDGGEWPANSPLKLGSIIRVENASSPRPGPTFNEQTNEWVIPRWVECEDPRRGMTERQRQHGAHS